MSITLSKEIFKILIISLVAIPVLFTLYSIPAMLTLPSGIRPGIEELKIEQAVDSLKLKNLPDLQLIQETRKLLVTRMQYCRRNSYDNYKTAFRRGYGYCVQQAYALQYMLSELGFNAKVVQSTNNRFADGSTGGHSWVRIELNDSLIDIDPSDTNWHNDKITFVSITEVTEFGFFFKMLTLWGSAGVNAHRFYTTGMDE